MWFTCARRVGPTCCHLPDGGRVRRVRPMIPCILILCSLQGCVGPTSIPGCERERTSTFVLESAGGLAAPGNDLRPGEPGLLIADTLRLRSGGQAEQVTVVEFLDNLGAGPLRYTTPLTYAIRGHAVELQYACDPGYRSCGTFARGELGDDGHLVFATAQGFRVPLVFVRVAADQAACE